MRELDVPPIGDAKYEVGYGLVVSIPTPNAELWVRVGSRRFMEMEQITIPSHIQKAEERCFDSGYSLVYLAIDSQLAGAIELQPTIRPSAARIIRQLQQQNIEIVIIGDGINDSIAMKKANVAISLRGASSIATDTAHVILMDGTLNQVTYLLNLSKELDTNLKTGEIMSVIPGIICVGGVFFLNFGIISAIMLYNIGLVASVSNALWPLMKEKAKVGVKKPELSASLSP